MKKTNNSGYFYYFLMFVMVIIFLVLLLPIPVILLDILIAINILLAFFLLIDTAAAEKQEDYFSLPFTLLCFTLLNIITSIAAIRVILTAGDRFNGLLIGFISSLISSYGITGVIISSVIMIIILWCFIFIIFKNSLKTAGTAAVYIRDSIPVKLSNIEAELESKLITAEEASLRKNDINSDSDYLNSLKDADKFIKGNAITTIVILVFTIAAGIFIQTKFNDAEMTDTIITYCSLAIGSCFLTVIPVFFLSASAVIAVIRLVNVYMKDTR